MALETDVKPTSTEQPLRGKVHLYACGGGGINIGQQLEHYRTVVKPAFAELDITYVDTSKANLNEKIRRENLYLLEGVDGSGSLRAENAAEISEQVRNILLKHKPSDMNIVLSTAAGGSGSVAGPAIASELLARGLPVIVVTVGDKTTGIATNNTLRTLKSYEAISKLHERPVVMYYEENVDSVSQANVDRNIASTVSTLLALFSRNNKRLDSKDLFNWLNYQRVTSFPPRLSTLSLVTKPDDLNDDQVVAVATLGVEGKATDFFGESIEYQCVGYMSGEVSDTIRDSLPVHFVIGESGAARVASRLETVLEKLDEQRQARKASTSLLTERDRPLDNGLVL